MISANSRPYVTAEEYLTHPLGSGPGELVRGEIRVMTPASGGHGVIAGRIFLAIANFVDEHQLGVCFPDNTGFHLPNLVDTVRSPDAAFLCNERIPVEGIGAGWVPVAPDLVVEILSPDNSRRAVDDKMQDYRTAGVRLAWVIDPRRRGVSVRLAGDGNGERWLSESDTLDGGDVLPGFSMPVARLFARLAR
jgi:Uma2 family endonuclease